MAAVWAGLWLLVLMEALIEVLSSRGADGASAMVAQVLVLTVATMLCLGRARYEDQGTRPWLWIGAGLACWTLGTTVWDIGYSADRHPPYPTVADALWLAWYPVTGVGMALLVKERVRRFELHRWLDGLAVALVVMTAAIALIVQPVVEDSNAGGFATIVDFIYPVLDVLVLGGILGVCGLLGWRPGRTWVWLALGCGLIALADGIFSVEQARDSVVGVDYDFLWALGALLIAAAARVSTSIGPATDQVFGWRAIVLPVAAQLCAVGIQLYAFFHEIGRSERLVSVVVLTIAIAQIVISRPRPPGPESRS